MARKTTSSTSSGRRRGGFTLVEMLVVIGILAVLASIVIPMVRGAIRRASRVALQADIQGIAAALEEYRRDHGDYPRTTFDTTANLAEMPEAQNMPSPIP